jgi:hypothetical protein
MVMISKKVSDKFLSNIGLFENMLGSKYAKLVAINQKKERIKKILYEVYGYKDIYNFFPEELDQDSVDKVLRTVFTYHESPQQQNEK